jgi:hypothetical protein
MKANLFERMMTKHVISNAMKEPLPAHHRDSAVTAYYIAVDSLYLGRGTWEDFNTIVEAINIGRILAEKGVGEDYKELIKSALSVMVEVQAHQKATGRYFMHQPGVEVLSEMGALHEAQMELATMHELAKAEAEMHNRIEGGNLL